MPLVSCLQSADGQSGTARVAGLSEAQDARAARAVAGELPAELPRLRGWPGLHDAGRSTSKVRCNMVRTAWWIYLRRTLDYCLNRGYGDIAVTPACLLQRLEEWGTEVVAILWGYRCYQVLVDLHPMYFGLLSGLHGVGGSTSNVLWTIVRTAWCW